MLHGAYLCSPHRDRGRLHKQRLLKSLLGLELDEARAHDVRVGDLHGVLINPLLIQECVIKYEEEQT